MNDPRDVAIDADGHLIVVNRGTQCLPCPWPDSEIVRIDPETGVQSVIVEFPFSDFRQPRQIAIDASGDLFATTTSYNILRINPITGDFTVISTYPFVANSSGIVIDEYGDLIDVGVKPFSTAYTVVRINPETGALSEILEVVDRVTSIAIDAYGDLLLTVVAPRLRFCVGGSNDGNVCSNGLDCIPGGSCVRASSILRVDLETGDQTVISSGGVSWEGISVDANGDIFVLEYATSFILRIDPTTGEQEIVSQGGYPPFKHIAVVPNFEIEIELDIHPGSDANRINPSSRGAIPVAILGSDDFDVADVDVTTLACGPDGAAPEHKQGGHAVDINQDGLTDLLSHYRTQETGIAPGDTQACVSGLTLDGIPFQGCDEITTVPARGIRAD